VSRYKIWDHWNREDTPHRSSTIAEFDAVSQNGRFVILAGDVNERSHTPA
jgi:hypothetical protein